MDAPAAPPKHQFWKEILLPTLTFGLAVFGAWQAWENARQKTLADANAAVLSEKNAELGRLRYELDREGSSRAKAQAEQAFMLKVFEFVENAVTAKTPNPRQEAAALALVDTLPDSQAKLSLSKILQKGADNEAVRTGATGVAQGVAQTLAKWDNWDIDIFWCEASGASARALAERMVMDIRRDGATGRVRARGLSADKNAERGYGYAGFQVAYNAGSEEDIAEKLKALMSRVAGNAPVALRRATSPTRWYVSGFVCPTP